MCCFSGPVTEVSATRIFARLITAKRQALAYQMSLDTPDDVAMILPIPVTPGSGEKAVKFIDLSEYPNFFRDLASGFITRKSYGASDTGSLPPDSKTLEVYSVGSFDASFVPTIRDFSRLDKRFRLPEGTWSRLPQYANYGFAVFKLKKGNEERHPMAFSFPSSLASRNRLFFPTVHIHDGKVHAKERFDHHLYGQSNPKWGLSSRLGWSESPALAASFTDPEKSQGLIEKNSHVYRLKLSGIQPNKDIVGQTFPVG
ncbi:MAG: hypothetical protein ACON5N_04920 [Akkermansiaceae bacterium]